MAFDVGTAGGHSDPGELQVELSCSDGEYIVRVWTGHDGISVCAELKQDASTWRAHFPAKCKCVSSAVCKNHRYR